MKEIAVKFNSVSFSYGDIPVLENASFHIHRGEFVAMVGPNGSGKTTVLKLLFGLEKPSAGNIDIFCKADGMAYVPQHPPADQSFPITVHDVVRMGLLQPLKGYSHSADKVADTVADAMEKAGVAELSARPYSALSGGEKRRTLVARALCSAPDLLVLDEPTANMDGKSEARLYETLARYKGNTTILIVTHDTEFVSSLTDRVLCLGDDRFAVVQHRLTAETQAHHGAMGARVLHGENISGDDCCV